MFIEIVLIAMLVGFLFEVCMWFFTGETWQDAYDDGMGGRPTKRESASPYSRLKKLIGLR